MSVVVATGGAIEIADYLLHLLVERSATAVWFEPSTEGAHRILIEQGSDVLRSAQVEGGLGDAILNRLALIAELAVSNRQSHAGTARIRTSGRDTEVVVTARATDRGLVGELRRLERVTPVRTGTIEVVVLDEIFELGTAIGSYVVTGKLGRGGMGLVYEVEHEGLKRRFAMKVLASEVLERDPLSSRRFVREARAAACVQHPGIVGVTDFGTLPDGRPYLIMDLQRGQTISKLRESEGALAPERALRIAGHIAEALAAAHERGVVHRDLTPGNVFVTGEGEKERIVLVDFGSAVSPDPESADVPDGPPGIVIGTPHYMAPEHILGRETDARTDLYGLGVLLFELLAGKVPFDGATPRDIVLSHVRDPAPTVSSPHGELPPEIKQLVARALAKDPAARIPSARVFAFEIDRCVEALHRPGGWRRWLRGGT